jgi:hypothetical protein
MCGIGSKTGANFFLTLSLRRLSCSCAARTSICQWMAPTTHGACGLIVSGFTWGTSHSSSLRTSFFACRAREILFRILCRCRPGQMGTCTGCVQFELPMRLNPEGLWEMMPSPWSVTISLCLRNGIPRITGVQSAGATIALTVREVHVQVGSRTFNLTHSVREWVFVSDWVQETASEMGTGFFNVCFRRLRDCAREVSMRTNSEPLSRRDSTMASSVSGPAWIRQGKCSCLSVRGGRGDRVPHIIG